MQATNDPFRENAIEGINQQDIDEIQSLIGVYPEKAGLQQRIPGKSFISSVEGPIGGIHVFYLVYGRPRIITDFDGNLDFEEIDYDWDYKPPRRLEEIYDDFEGYADAFVSPYFPAGLWPNFWGIVYSIQEEAFEDFESFDDASEITELPETEGWGGDTAGGDNFPPMPDYPPTPPLILLYHQVYDDFVLGPQHLEDRVLDEDGDLIIDSASMTIGQEVTVFGVTIRYEGDNYYGVCMGGGCVEGAAATRARVDYRLFTNGTWEPIV